MSDEGENVINHDFGGHWTEKKLDCVKQYLEPYLTATKNKGFHRVYIDAFAGTGYRNTEGVEATDMEEAQQLSDGSARIALKLGGFDEYILVEQDKRHCEALEKLKKEFPDRKITIINSDANDFLLSFCKNKNWQKTRAVLFLDPYGLSVKWTTLVQIAATKAIDVWYLIPVGQEINRLLF